MDPWLKLKFWNLPKTEFGLSLVYLVYKNVVFNMDLESPNARKWIFRYRWLNKVIPFMFQVFYYGPMAKT